MLHLKKVLAAKPKEHVVAKLHPLFTPWGEQLDASHVLEEHPCPQFARPSYRVLNGTWQCAFAQSGHEPTADLEEVVRLAKRPAPEEFAQDIVVPFSPEAALSGVGRQLQPDELLWYRRGFTVDGSRAGMREILHFQAVDYACAVWVNDSLVGTHAGGYAPFAFDVTDWVVPGENELVLCVADPSEFGGHLRGKQRFDRGDIWYTAQSGIWQTVWMETVPARHIVSAKIEPDAETGVLVVGLHVALGDDAHSAESTPNEGACSGGGDPDPGARAAADASRGDEVHLEVVDGLNVVAQASCTAEAVCAIALHVPNVHRWSPDDPHLYTLRLRFGDDVVESYCGFRTVEVRRDRSGSARLYVNGEPFFVRGVLDQGYWPDGLMTAPSDEALLFDVRTVRDAGFNCMRKHIKVESERWYYHCDKMGMLVWQDMVSGGAPELSTWEFSYQPTLFKPSWDHYGDTSSRHQEALGAGSKAYQDEWLRSCVEEMQLLGNHPSIVIWTLFNEGWGQFDSRRAYRVAQQADPTRPICATSGWYDQGAGEIRGVHNYFRDFKVWKRGLRNRAFFISEFGGFAHRVEGHSSLDDVYGYEVYDSVDEWRTHTLALLDEVAALERKGLAGFVLTQLSDVEEESNGLLTYDRRINKLDVTGR